MILPGRVTIADIRSTTYCMNGARRWFDQRDLSWTDFLDNGMTLQQADNFHDAFADAVAAKARLRMRVS